MTDKPDITPERVAALERQLCELSLAFAAHEPQRMQALEAATALHQLQARVAELEGAIDLAKCNIGVPQPGYPGSVSEAHRILDSALAQTTNAGQADNSGGVKE